MEKNHKKIYHITQRTEGIATCWPQACKQSNTVVCRLSGSYVLFTTMITGLCLNEMQCNTGVDHNFELISYRSQNVCLYAVQCIPLTVH